MNICLTLLGALAALTTFQLTAAESAAPSQKLVVGYLPNWNDVNSVLKSTDLTKITHLDVAFENPVDDAGNLSFNALDDTIIKAGHAANVKVLVSIGGGGASEDKGLTARYFALQSDAKRASFVAKLVQYVDEHNFDGLDIDLEGPSIGKDYGAFVSELSQSLLPIGKLLTAAVSRGYGGDQIPSSTFTQFSFVNVMAYDGTGPWNPNQPGQHSSMSYTKDNVTYWVARGLEKSKIVLGVPFYGYGFGPAFRTGDYSFSEIVKTFPGSETADQVGNTIWYNGIPTIKAKAKYVVDQGLLGVMIWELGSDATGDKSLLSAIYSTLNPSK